jgi:APA family basic amino acid/polyamine antiporter
MLARENTTPAATLERRLGLWSAIFLVIGITIGSGIFRTPAVVASRVPDPLAVLGVWLAGGLMALAGALSFAELSASLPHSGGPYVFLREGLGRLPAFMYGWTQLTLLRATSLAAIATVFSEYLLRSLGFIPSEDSDLVGYVAAAALAFATTANVLGVRLGAWIVGLTTTAKYGGLAAIICAAFLLGDAHGASAAHFTESAGDVTISMFGLALVSVLWAYDGFADLSFAAGEVADPQRNMPRALILGTFAIVAIYLLANVAYLYVLPFHTLASSPLVAADTLAVIFGRAGVTLVSVLVMISTFGTLNGVMLSSPRIFFAMADDGLLFRRVAAVHPTFGTPHVAVLLTGMLGIVLALIRTFEQLTETFVLATWPFHLLTIVALYRLRRTRPDMKRPYKAVGYPYVPAIFAAASAFLMLNALIAQPLETGIVLALILIAVPVYAALFRER